MLEESTDLVMQQLLEMSESPDAILCFSDHIAIKAIEIAKGKAISGPDQLGFVGFSNILIGSYITPSLTTVNQPTYEMGQLATKLILSEVNDPGDFSHRRLVLKKELIIRDSSRGKKL